VKTLLHNNLITISITLISALYVFFCITLLGESVYFWTPDSASYIEAARNFSSMGKLVISTALNAEMDLQPLKLWPPGYPLILSVTQDILGVDSQWLIVHISIFSWVIVPTLIFVLVRPLLGVSLSAALSIAILTSPAFLDWGWKGLSDLPFLFVVVLGLLLSSNLSSGWKPIISIFIGGILLGISFSIRNIGVAALIAVFISYVITFFARQEQRREIFLKIVVWSTGASIIVLPVFIRNIMVFGTLQPYSMQASTVSLLTNIRVNTKSIMLDLFGSQNLAEIIAWDFLVFASCALVFTGLSAYYAYRHSSQIKENGRILAGELICFSQSMFVFFSLFIYALLSIAIVIYARTKYEWGEPINLRHVLQYNWAIIAIVLFLLLRLIKSYHAKNIAYALLALMIFGHIVYLSKNYYLNEPSSKERLLLKYNTYIDADLKNEIINISHNGGVIASNHSDVLRITSGVPIRSLSVNSEQLERSIKNQLLAFKEMLIKTQKKGFVFIFLEENSLEEFIAEEPQLSEIIIERRTESLIVFYLFPR